jgi:hypothetical protein
MTSRKVITNPSLILASRKASNSTVMANQEALNTMHAYIVHFYGPFCDCGPTATFVPAVACNVILAVACCCRHICFLRQCCCCVRLLLAFFLLLVSLLIPDVLTVAGRPAIAGVPAVAGILAIASVPVDSGVLILPSFYVLY